MLPLEFEAELGGHHWGRAATCQEQELRQSRGSWFIKRFMRDTRTRAPGPGLRGEQLRDTLCYWEDGVGSRARKAPVEETERRFSGWECPGHIERLKE